MYYYYYYYYYYNYLYNIFLFINLRFFKGFIKIYCTHEKNKINYKYKFKKPLIFQRLNRINLKFVENYFIYI
jgi:hypothetical protein